MALAEQLDFAQSDLKEVKMRLETASDGLKAIKSQNDTYRAYVVEGETVMTSQANEVKEMLRKMTNA